MPKSSPPSERPTFIKAELFSAHEHLLSDEALRTMLAETQAVLSAVDDRLACSSMLMPAEEERLVQCFKKLSRRESALVAAINRRGA